MLGCCVYAGFEIKRRGELKIIKNFQVSRALSPRLLLSAVAECGVCGLCVCVVAHSRKSLQRSCMV